MILSEFISHPPHISSTPFDNESGRPHRPEGLGNSGIICLIEFVVCDIESV